jgi:hypothetical protein
MPPQTGDQKLLPWRMRTSPPRSHCHHGQPSPFQRDYGPDVTYTYSQEAMPDPVDADWDDEESSFAEVRQQVQERNEPVLE